MLPNVTSMAKKPTKHECNQGGKQGDSPLMGNAPTRLAEQQIGLPGSRSGVKYTASRSVYSASSAIALKRREGLSARHGQVAKRVPTRLDATLVF